jgi:uncharacterized protein DUF6894
MPVFYFDVADGRCLSDEEGAEFPDLAEARSAAIGVLLDIAPAHLQPEATGQDLICTVRDDSQRPVLRVELSLQIWKP